MGARFQEPYDSETLMAQTLIGVLGALLFGGSLTGFVVWVAHRQGIAL